LNRQAPPTGAIDRALAVLDVLAEATAPIGVTEIARRLGLPKSVVHYHVSALVRNRYVEVTEDRRYGLGYAALRLARSSHNHTELRARAQGMMRSLHQETRETITLSALVGPERIYVDQLVSPHEIKMSVELGRSFPLHAGASGKVMLAFLPESARRSVLQRRLERLTRHTLTDLAALEAELAQIRESGTAASRSERQEGAASVAAAVLDGHGVIGSMSVCGPEYRFDDAAVARYRPLVRVAAESLSRELGAEAGG
jgi:IclR family transcriptional regulator, acetate operon repressor